MFPPTTRMALLISSLCFLYGVTPASLAAPTKVILQDNPVFTTPAPEAQPLGPSPEKPFLKGVIRNEVTDPESIPQQADRLQLETIQFEGNHYYRDAVIQRQLKPLLDDPAKAMDAQHLEQELVRINKQNPFKLRARITPGSSPDKANLMVDVYERQPWQLTSTFDNQGRPLIGTYRWGHQLTHESLLGYGDKLNLQYIGSVGSYFFNGSYDVPINRRGGTIGGFAEYTRNSLDFPVALQDRSADQVGIGFRYIQPLDLQRIWTADIGVTGREIRVNNLHVQPRFISAGLRFNKPDKWGLTHAYAQTYLGEQWLGGNARFWRVRGQMTRTFNLPHDSNLILRGSWQYSPDALIPVQMFPLAGAYAVRGFSEGMLYSDSAQLYNIEYRWPIPFLAQVNPTLAQRVKGVVFYDIAQGWLRGSRVVNNHNTTLMSAGLGLRCRLTQYLQGFVDSAWRIGGTNNFSEQNLGAATLGSTFRIHFGLRSELLPKSYEKRSDHVAHIDSTFH